MKDNFIKGFLYKEIYRNEINGYMVGLFKIKDNNIDYDDDMIHITGILPRLSEKKEYIFFHSDTSSNWNLSVTNIF